MPVNTKGLSNYLDYLSCYNVASKSTKWITVVGLEFIPNKLGLDIVIFILFIDDILIVF